MGQASLKFMKLLETKKISKSQSKILSLCSDSFNIFVYLKADLELLRKTPGVYIPLLCPVAEKAGKLTI